MNVRMKYSGCLAFDLKAHLSPCPTGTCDGCMAHASVTFSPLSAPTLADFLTSVLNPTLNLTITLTLDLTYDAMETLTLLSSTIKAQSKCR